MHPDRKIGIAMGILLVGVVGALFFRNESVDPEYTMDAEREARLNEQLRDRDVSLYSDEEDSVTNHSSAQDQLNAIMQRHSGGIGYVPVPVRHPDQDRMQPAAPIIEEPLRFAPPAPSPSEEQERQPQSVVSQQEASARPEEPRPSANRAKFTEYVVRPGDTLSEIAEKQLGSQARYKEIFEANRDTMASPNQLRVGKAIRIPRL